jgi:hypothetical protein
MNEKARLAPGPVGESGLSDLFHWMLCDCLAVLAYLSELGEVPESFNGQPQSIRFLLASSFTCGIR